MVRTDQGLCTTANSSIPWTLLWIFGIHLAPGYYEAKHLAIPLLPRVRWCVPGGVVWNPGTRGPTLTYPLEGSTVLFGGGSSSILPMTVYAWVTLTLRRNRQGARSNCLSFGGSYPRLQPGGARLESRVQSARNVRRPAHVPIAARVLVSSSLAPLFPSACQKRNLRTLVKRQFMLSGVFRLFFKCHLSCFADRFTEKTRQTAFVGFYCRCLVEEAWQ
jgi:hypothetical protein